jgi:hypothetical protein
MTSRRLPENPSRLWAASGAFRRHGSRVWGYIKQHFSAGSEAWICGLMALAVMGFSITAVTFDLLVGDDLAFYQLASDGDWEIAGLNRMLLAPVINHYLAELMVISPTLARLAVLLLGMVPVSILAYIVFTRVLSLPRTVAFFSALLPHILPAQQQVPTYVIGSYMT